MPANRPLDALSVILPVYNAAETVGRQLEALASQTWRETWEVIVADNGSSDESLSICRRYCNRIENLRIVDASKRPGAAYARNTAVSIARYENLAFCDADDEAAPGWVEAMASALAKHNFVAGRIDRTTLNEPWLFKTRPAMPNHKEYFDRKMAVVSSCNFGIKRSLYEAVGGFDISIPRGTPCEDEDFSVRVQLTGAGLYFAYDALVHYRYRRTLRAIFKQARSYGRGDAFMADRYANIDYWRPDKPDVAKLLRDALLRGRSKGDLGRLLWEIGRSMGRSGW